MHQLYCGDALEVMRGLPAVTCIFADPPDNIGTDYAASKDRQPEAEYVDWLRRMLCQCLLQAQVVWVSFNAKWICPMGRIVEELQSGRSVVLKPCVQVYTFGQHNHLDLGNNHRPLWRLAWDTAQLYPDAIRVPSWRQEHGDKRADPRGRVPGDVFDYPRVTGNSKQRRPWHPTQLHEDLVERCLLLSTKPGDTVLDPFAGTGTTLRVAKRIGRPCTLIEMDPGYCAKIAQEHGMEASDEKAWQCASGHSD